MFAVWLFFCLFWCKADFRGGRLNVFVFWKWFWRVIFTLTFNSARTINPPTHIHKHTHTHTLFYPPGRFLVISIFHKGAHAVPIISGLQSAASSTYSFLRGQQYCTDTAPNHCLCLCVCACVCVCVCTQEGVWSIFHLLTGCLQPRHELLRGMSRNFTSKHVL